MKEGDLVTLKLNERTVMIIRDDRWLSGGLRRYPDYMIRMEDMTTCMVYACELEELNAQS